MASPTGMTSIGIERVSQLTYHNILTYPSDKSDLRTLWSPRCELYPILRTTESTSPHLEKNHHNAFTLHQQQQLTTSTSRCAINEIPSRKSETAPSSPFQQSPAIVADQQLSSDDDASSLTATDPNPNPASLTHNLPIERERESTTAIIAAFSAVINPLPTTAIPQTRLNLTDHTARFSSLSADSVPSDSRSTVPEAFVRARFPPKSVRTGNVVVTATPHSSSEGGSKGWTRPVFTVVLVGFIFFS